MRARDATSNLSKESTHDFDELNWLHDIHNLFKFIQKHDLFGAVDFRPILEQTSHHLINYTMSHIQ